MRQNLTFIEAIWIMLLYILITNFSWIMLAVVVIIFPRWVYFMDRLKTNAEYRKHHKRTVDEIKADVIKQMEEDDQEVS